MKTLPPAQCASCSNELPDDARFCAQCGASVPSPAGGEDPLRHALEAKLKGQYRLIRLLGRGGMGAVYLARDLVLDREVAIKVVSTVADSAEMKDRFRREARTAAKLSHPNIVSLYSFGEVEGMPYFVMGYVRGESLAARLRRDGKIAEEESRAILANIADALDHAHRQGVIHRDLKPDNVLLEDESGRALLTDFGVAKAVGRGETLTRLGNAVGTPHYMSPEQASGNADIDGRSDIYSFGVMAYAMLTGRLPFEGKTPAEVLTKHLTQTPPRLSAIAPAISESMIQVVDRCLAKDPSKRWSDAQSLKKALGVSEESALPEDLRTVEGFGAFFLLLMMVFYARVVGGIVSGDVKDSLYIAVFLTAAAIVTLAFLTIRLRLDGYSIRQSLRAISTEPSWWLTWYPRTLRRPGNVWDRLPSSVRAMRWWYAPLLLAGYLIVVFLESGRWGPQLLPTLSDLAVGVSLLGVLAIVLYTPARRELRNKGLTGGDVQRVAFAAPLSRISFWSRPPIAAILEPAGSAESSSDSPNDRLQSILRNANELSGPLRPLGAQAAAAARQLLESINDADREIASLAKSIEPGEETRLSEKIAALTHEEQAPLRSLLEKQLELIRGLSARIDEAQERRNRRTEMLKMLALHVASLRSRVAETPSEVRLISDNVRALCDDIAQQEVAIASGATTVAADAKTIQR